VDAAASPASGDAAASPQGQLAEAVRPPAGGREAPGVHASIRNPDPLCRKAQSKPPGA
jgi:hypothetical protein